MKVSGSPGQILPVEDREMLTDAALTGFTINVMMLLLAVTGEAQSNEEVMIT
jgi:hypothetical protein